VEKNIRGRHKLVHEKGKSTLACEKTGHDNFPKNASPMALILSSDVRRGGGVRKGYTASTAVPKRKEIIHKKEKAAQRDRQALITSNLKRETPKPELTKEWRFQRIRLKPPSGSKWLRQLRRGPVGQN